MRNGLFAPMPSASVKTAMIVKPGELAELAKGVTEIVHDSLASVRPSVSAQRDLLGRPAQRAGLE